MRSALHPLSALRPLLALLAATTLLAAACGSDDSTDSGAADGGTDAGGAADGSGIVAVRVEPVEGFFTEGFEIGLRFETAAGDRVATAIWSDAVTAAGDPAPDAFYTHVLEQEVPAGDVVVLASVNIGIGPPPETPDVEGDLRCRLELSVPDGGRVDVEVSFTDADCLKTV